MRGSGVADQLRSKYSLTLPLSLAKGEATLFQKISREYTKQTGMEIKAVLLRTGAGARGLLSLTRW